MSLTTADDEVLDTLQAAELLGFKPVTLDIWRSKGAGPPYVKLGRSVRYHRRTIIQWAMAQTRNAPPPEAA